MKHLAIAALLAASSALPAFAADVTLTMSSWLPPRHPIVVNAMKPWAEEIEKATEGRVTVTILAKPAGAPPAHFDMVKDGVVDLAYGLHSFTQDDRFTGSQIGQFSFIGDDAVAASKAFWTVYTEDLGAETEHEGAKLLGLFVHGPGVIWNNQRKLESVDDLKGLKIRVPGGYIAGLMEDLGASTLFMSSPEVYEKLSRGVIDGVTFTYEALTAFKLTGDIKYGATLPGGVYNTSWFLVANPAAWDKISPADQEAIMAISGPAFAERVGAAWMGADAAAMPKLEEAGIEISEAPAALLEAVRASASAREAAWAEKVGAQGHDGLAALARLRGMTGVAQ